MQVPEEFAYPAEAVVLPIVSMGRDGLPMQRPDAGEACDVHADLLGVLNGHKRVAMVPVATIRPGGHPPDSNDEPVCAGRPVRDGWAAWHGRLLSACQDAGLAYLRVTKEVAYVFGAANLKYAALLYLLYHAPDHERRRLDALDEVAGGFVIGRLLGYEDRDIEAWYLGQVLSLITLSDVYRVPARNRPEVAARTACVRRVMHESFMRMATVAEATAASMLRGPEVGEAVEQLARRVRPVRATAAAAPDSGDVGAASQGREANVWPTHRKAREANVNPEAEAEADRHRKEDDGGEPRQQRRRFKDRRQRRGRKWRGSPPRSPT